APVLADRCRRQARAELAATQHDVTERVAVRPGIEHVVALDLALHLRADALHALGGALALLAPPDLVKDRLEVGAVVRRIGQRTAAADLEDLPLGLAFQAHGKPGMTRDAV